MLKNAEGNATMTGLGIESPVTENIQGNKAEPLYLQSLWLDEALHELTCHTEMILTKEEQIVPKTQKETAQEKNIPEEPEEQKLMAQE